MHEQENEITNMRKRERERKQCNLVESVGVKDIKGFRLGIYGAETKV